MFRYWYAQLSTDGYRWNVLARISYAIGIEPQGTGDSGGQTYLDFSRELTQAEQATVAAIMADNPTYPPTTTNTVGTIRDVWSQKAYFQTQIGLTYDLYYDESVRGSGNIDVIKLYFKKALSNSEKNTVKTQYAALCSIS